MRQREGHPGSRREQQRADAENQRAPGEYGRQAYEAYAPRARIVIPRR